MSAITKDLATLKAEEQKIWNVILVVIHKVEDALQKFMVNDITIIVGIVSKVKTAIESQSATVVADVLDVLFKSQIPTEILGVVKLALVKAMAYLAAVELPTDFNNEEALKTWLTNVLAILKVKPNKSEIFSTIFAHLLMEVRAFTSNGVAPTFAQAIAFGEEEYQFIKTTLADAPSA